MRFYSHSSDDIYTFDSVAKIDVPEIEVYSPFNTHGSGHIDAPVTGLTPSMFNSFWEFTLVSSQALKTPSLTVKDGLSKCLFLFLFMLAFTLRTCMISHRTF